MKALRPLSLLTAALALTACTAVPTSPTPTGASGSTRASSAEPLVTHLDAPWSIAFHDDTALVSERDTARILELSPDGDPREVGVIEGVAPRGEGGLLGLAVRQATLYAYFTTGDENRIERYRLTGEPGSLSLGPAETILDDLPAASYHNGGRIAFGPDQMLYVTVGDAGNRASAQDLDALSGKILRLTPDGGVPADNPFPGSLVYSYGHRNPQGIAWSDDGAMYASEFGQDTFDELNLIQPGGNYGWPTVEGIANQDGFINPVQQWEPAAASPSGMTIANGHIYLANLRGERLREIPLTDPATSTEHLIGAYGRLRDVALAPDGSLWVLTNNTDGRGDPGPDDDRILRIHP